MQFTYINTCKLIKKTYCYKYIILGQSFPSTFFLLCYRYHRKNKYQHRFFSVSYFIQLAQLQSGVPRVTMHTHTHTHTRTHTHTHTHTNLYIQSDQKVSVHLMITIQKSGVQRLFDHPVYVVIRHFRYVPQCYFVT